MQPDLPPQAQVPQPLSPPGENEEANQHAHVRFSVDLPPGTRLRITVEALPANGQEASAGQTVILSQEGEADQPLAVSVPVIAQGSRVAPFPAFWKIPARWAASLRSALRAWPHSLAASLFGLALALYLLTRFIGLSDFPIYFFTDEAVQTVLAADLVRDNFKDYEQVFLPTYFKNGTQYNLSASVYLQVLPYVLFGKSVAVTRGVAVLVTLLAALSIALILRETFKIPYWWSGTLLLSISPAWFLHSRTAFETTLFVSLYAALLYAYLLYRLKSPRYLFVVVALAALAFYSYSPGQIVVAVTALLLLISDARYHWQNRYVVLRALALGSLLAAPYLRFFFTHPTAFGEHLNNLASYWVQPLPLAAKLGRYFSEYLYGLSPGYWFVPNDHDLPRHLMKGYGHLLRATLPFALIGLVLALKQIRQPAYRVILAALLAAPAGAALVQIGITRTLVFVIPATLLTALGLSWALTFLERYRLRRAGLSIALFAGLALFNLSMTRDALVNGPTWYQDYGLGGMQYGAEALFGELKEIFRQDPSARLIVSPSWANGTDVVARFFFPDPVPFNMGSIESFIFQRLPLDDSYLFVQTPAEYEQTVTSGKFADIKIEKTILYPNGKPGFYFIRLRYVDNIDEILVAEREARRILLDGEITWGEQAVQVKYPYLDMGEILNAFDGDADTLLRTLEANPLIFDLQFPQPVTAEALYLKFGSTEARVLVRLYPVQGDDPLEFKDLLFGSLEKPDGVLSFKKSVTFSRMRLEITDTRQTEPGHVHIWEIALR